MFVFNNCLNDARVLKEAKTLIDAGYQVEVIAILDKKTIPQQVINSVPILRIDLNPIHIRIIRFFSNPLNSVRIPKWLRLRKRATSQVGNQQGWWDRTNDRLKHQLIGFLGRKGYKLDEESESFSLDVLRLISKDLKLIVIGFVPMTIYLSFMLLKYGYIYAVRYPIILLKRMFRLTWSFLKKTAVRFSRFVIQPIVRAVLLPYHKYFTYYDFYNKSVAYSKKKPSEIYHCHDLNTLRIGIELKKCQPQSRLVYDSHELYLHKNRLHQAGRFKQRMLRNIEAKGMHVSDRAITVGPCIADWLANEYKVDTPAVILNAPNMKQIPDDTETNLKNILAIKPEHFLLIYSGGITFNRGLEKVIEAISITEGVHFVMLGFSTDEYRASLELLIDKFKVRDRVSFYGPVPHEQVAAFLHNADCGIAPIKNICLSYYFCSPNKLFEFVQARLPVLASNFPEMERIVRDYQIGYTFDPEHSEEISDVIKKMMTNPDKREEFRANAAKAAAVFNWEEEEKKLLDIYAMLKKTA